MWGSRQKRRTTRIDTLGDIRFSGGLHVDGTIKGNVIADKDSRSMLSLDEKGTIEGEVSVPYVVINGVVIGDVHSGDHVELSPKARVTGNVYYNLIEMAIGAEVNGKLVHSPNVEDSPLALGHIDPLEAD